MAIDHPAFEDLIDGLKSYNKYQETRHDYYIKEIIKVEREKDKLQYQIDELKKYFTSGNPIPVERATILAKDFWRIIDEEPITNYEI